MEVFITQIGGFVNSRIEEKIVHEKNVRGHKKGPRRGVDAGGRGNTGRAPVGMGRRYRNWGNTRSISSWFNCLY